ncbi:hypothetical protein MPSEU_001041400 [Mayamaea pseudoterrestris]|nr:hypothetical protein MPSEU_001041400 [Mayamaea pseudoterrestris]
MTVEQSASFEKTESDAENAVMVASAPAATTINSSAGGGCLIASTAGTTCSVISATTEQEIRSAPLTTTGSLTPLVDSDVPSQVIMPSQDDAADVSGAVLRVILPENGSDNPPFIVEMPTPCTNLETVSCPADPLTEPESSLQIEPLMKPQQEHSSTPISMGNTRDIDHLDEYIRSPEVQNAIVDRSPGGRYVRFLEKLGSGASKDVYRAYDTQEGIEVAWNVVNLSGVPKLERNRIVNEVRLLERLHHQNIISFHGSWVNRERQEVNFVTEILSSGTLKSFINKVQLIRWKIAKRWATQILKGLEYLHSQDPPVIHRDLKAENIFINGTSGDLRIGDLGLSTVHRNGRVLSVLGTPEFMAPDMYEDGSYDVKVDIYAFGMVLLEIFTKEIPYSECMNPAQIYKKVSAGEPPEVLKRLESRHAREFVKQCLGYKDDSGNYIRPTAIELLQHPFLEIREGLDDDEVLVRPPLRESVILEAGESSYSTSQLDATPMKNRSSASGHQTSQSELDQAQQRGRSTTPPLRSLQQVAPTHLEDDDDGDRFDEMPECETNFRRVTVMMGRGHELEDKLQDLKSESATNCVGDQSLNAHSVQSMPATLAQPVGVLKRNKQYLVAAAVVGPLDPGVRPYPDDILKLIVTLPVDGQTQNVQFDFHLIEDDPVQVAKEMVQELDIPNDAILEISQTISGLARTARMQVESFNVRRNESRLATAGQASEFVENHPRSQQWERPAELSSPLLQHSGHIPGSISQILPVQGTQPTSTNTRTNPSALFQGSNHQMVHPQVQVPQQHQLASRPAQTYEQSQMQARQSIPLMQLPHSQVQAPVTLQQMRPAELHAPQPILMPPLQVQQQTPTQQFHAQQQQTIPPSNQQFALTLTQQPPFPSMPGQMQQSQQHVPQQITLQTHPHGASLLPHAIETLTQQRMPPQLIPTSGDAQVPTPAALSLSRNVPLMQLAPPLLNAETDPRDLRPPDAQAEVCATKCNLITNNEWVPELPFAANHVDPNGSNGESRTFASGELDSFRPVIAPPILQGAPPKVVERSETAGSQMESTLASSPSMNGSTGPISPTQSEDVDIDSDVSDNEMDEELRKLEEDFQKNLQRTKKVYDNRMQSLQRTLAERETQHKKTLEKHEKEKADYEKRLAQEEVDQSRRLEQLQRDWEKKRSELAESRRRAQGNAVNALANGQMQLPSSEQSSILELSDRSQERSVSNAMLQQATVHQDN